MWLLPNFTRNMIYFCGILLFLQISKHQVESESIEWLNTYDQDPLFVLCQLQPAGDEASSKSKQYVCRVMHKGHWVPGRIHYHGNELKYKCHIAEGSEFGYVIGEGAKLQALVAPPGWTSWVQITDRYVLPPNPIEGGYHPGGEPAYVCRHQDKDGKILVGKYSERAGQCLYPYYGQKVADKNLEVLTINMFGMTMTARLEALQKQNVTQ